jgi:4,5-DOPA dioxygenase extradiol
MFPSLFVAHGAPTIAIEDSPYGRFLDRLGAALQALHPQGVVVWSAHWNARVQTVSASARHTTWHDFSGFPEELYQIEYPAPGDPALATRIANQLQRAGWDCRLDERRPLDHGIWTILRRLFPAADVPVVAMSVNPVGEPQALYEIGRTLGGLRDEGILMIASGVVVHNFDLLYAPDPVRVQAALAFEDWLEERLRTWDLTALFAYQETGPNASVAVPPHSQEHFLPIFYALGAADEERVCRPLYRGTWMDVMTESVYQFGGQAPLQV